MDADSSAAALPERRPALRIHANRKNWSNQASEKALQSKNSLKLAFAEHAAPKMGIPAQKQAWTCVCKFTSVVRVSRKFRTSKGCHYERAIFTSQSFLALHQDVDSFTWLIVAFLSAGSAMAHTVGSIPVTTCQAITQSGYYVLANDLTGIVTANNSCIQINASNVTLNLGSHKLTGPGDDLSYGIDILGDVKNTYIVGSPLNRPVISKYGDGILDVGNNTYIAHFEVDNNGFAGIFGESSSSVWSDFAANHNTDYGTPHSSSFGVFVSAALSLAASNFQAIGNTTAGVFVFGNLAGATVISLTGVQANQNGIGIEIDGTKNAFLSAFTANSNKGPGVWLTSDTTGDVVEGGQALFNSQNGVQIDGGSTNNNVSGNLAEINGGNDLFDGKTTSSSCVNQWFNNLASKTVGVCTWTSP
jgi:hypothetical protein